MLLLSLILFDYLNSESIRRIDETPMTSDTMSAGPQVSISNPSTTSHNTGEQSVVFGELELKSLLILMFLLKYVS